jgi:uncharacterized lipoprotein YbaY
VLRRPAYPRSNLVTVELLVISDNIVTNQPSQVLANIGVDTRTGTFPLRLCHVVA